MANDKLRILIEGLLNRDKTTENINKQLERIERRIKKLKLQVIIDENVVKELNNIINASDKIKDILKEQSQVVKKHEEIFKRADGTIEKFTQKHLKNGEVITESKRIIDQKTKSIENYTEAVERDNRALEEQGKLLKEIQVLNSKGELIKSQEVRREGFTTTITNFNADDKVTSSKIIQDYEKEEKTTRKLQKAKEDLLLSLKKLRQEGYVTTQELDKLDQAINLAKDIQEVDELKRKLKELQNISRQNARALEAEGRITLALNKFNDELEHRLQLFKKQAEINKQNLERRYRRGSIDNEGLEKWLQSVKELDVTTPNIQRRMRELALSFKEIEANARTSGSRVISFGEQLEVALERVPIWMAAMTAFYAPIRGMREAVQTIIEIDTQMTELARVLPEFTNFGNILENNIKLANELGKSIQDINEAAIGFARQGYDENQIRHLTETAIIAANVSELTVEESMETMTAAMEIFNIQAENSIDIINKLNEVDNNFAITTKDLALALQKAGSTAVAFGVTLDEMLGHITAIGVQTRESGSIVGKNNCPLVKKLAS